MTFFRTGNMQQTSVRCDACVQILVNAIYEPIDDGLLLVLGEFDEHELIVYGLDCINYIIEKH